MTGKGKEDPRGSAAVDSDSQQGRILRPDTRESSETVQDPWLALQPEAPCGDAPQGPYAFIAEIGRGGVGEVWEAMQTALGRTVAVKRLRSDLPQSVVSNPEKLRAYREVFRHEALTMGRLEHPNIVPVYDLCLDDNGALLLAMKRLHGRTWDQIIDEDFPVLTANEFLAKHLPILVDLANAVSYAHSKGIIHRDLKPNQVMVGEYGEVTLMDWGLAAPFRAITSPDSDEDRIPTTSPDPSGTPAYMAPEQLLRDPEKIGPWTDVYLLGGILYKLLTGRPPHDGRSSAEALQQAAEGYVTPLEEAALWRDVPGDLAELCQSALSKNPQERPGSVRDFIKAVQDHITGATRRRESREITELISESISLLFTSYTELAECLTQLERARLLWPENPQVDRLRQRILALYAHAGLKNDDLVLARAQAEQLTEPTIKAPLLASIASREAEKQAASDRLAAALEQANAERDRAEDLVTFMMRDLHASLRRIGRLDVLEQVAQKTLDYFDSLPRRNASPNALEQRVEALVQIGEVLEDRGNLRRARHTYREARDAATLLMARQPQNFSARALLARAWECLGRVNFEQRDHEGALQAQEAARELRGNLAAHDPSNEEWADQLALSHCHIGTVLWRMDRLDEALRAHEQSVAMRTQLLERNPRNRAMADHLAFSLNHLAQVQAARDEYDAAVATYQKALLLRQRYAALDPNDAPMQRGLAWTQASLARLHAKWGRFVQARGAFAQARRLLSQQAERDPANMKLQRELASLLSSLAEMERLSRNPDTAMELARRARDMQQRLVTEQPSYAGLRFELAATTHLLGDILRDMGNRERALQAYQEALLLRETLAAQRPDSRGTLHESLATEVQIARLQRDLGQGELSRTLLEKIVEALRPEIEAGHCPRHVLDTWCQAMLLLGREDEVATPLTQLLADNQPYPDLFELALEAGLVQPIDEATAERELGMT